MNALPANLPNIAEARLPATYEAAKNALAECSRLDECLTWANKAEALASYAKQAEDDQLRKMADRIQARAIRRCGELLKQIEAGNGARDGKRQEGDLPPFNRTQAATDAGLSEHQRKTALRVASVPAPEFNEQVESDDPPTVTELARQGTTPRQTAKPLVDLKGRDPEHYAASTLGQGQLRRFAEFATDTDPLIVAKGAMPHEIAAIRRNIGTVDGWLDRLSVALEG